MRTRHLTDPMPLLYDSANEKFIYVAPGPAVLVFMIDAKIIVRNNLISRKPVLGPEAHPFAAETRVCSLAELPVRKALAECEPVDRTEYDETLTLWCDFSDAVAERVHEGAEDLQTILETTWRLSTTSPTPGASLFVEDVGDVELDDEDGSTMVAS